MYICSKCAAYTYLKHDIVSSFPLGISDGGPRDVDLPLNEKMLYCTILMCITCTSIACMCSCVPVHARINTCDVCMRVRMYMCICVHVYIYVYIYILYIYIERERAREVYTYSYCGFPSGIVRELLIGTDKFSMAPAQG